MRTLFVVAALAAAPALAEHGFPDWVKFPPQIGQAEGQDVVAEDVADVEVPTPTGTNTVRGKHWWRWFKYTPKAGEPAVGYDNGTEERIAQAFEPLFKAAGWKRTLDSEHHAQQTLTLQRDGKTYWALLSMDAPQAQVRFEVVEVGGAAAALTLKPPAKKPETFKDTDDLPYLAPPPGSTRTGQGRGDDPLDVTFPDQQDDVRLVGSAAVRRVYQGPKSLSALGFLQAYRAALGAAGWTIVYPRTPADDAHEGKLIAHYAKDGRDLWAVLVFEVGVQLSFSVADVGAEDWAARLKKDCSVALHGVTFDFDKATLKPESTPLLEKAAAALKAVPGDVEVQGHTDAKGSADYNQKLSAARAQTVVDWLVKAGVEAKRLSAKGYGLSAPVADNATEVGRAKNRRVQLVRSGCKAGK